ncbi:MAG: OsmC family protein [Deltaproteobacteria bacterium]|nr:OsmC family protein [Deltaproteobacteria bacterium]
MATPTPTTVREFQLEARSTGTFGRVLCSTRHHHFIVDGPVQNGCAGEALTPPELFLSSVLTCGVELIEVIARDGGVALGSVRGTIRARLDRAAQAREDLTLFNAVALHFVLTGVSPAEAGMLVSGFQRRCPLYGSVAASIADVVVTHEVGG